MIRPASVLLVAAGLLAGCTGHPTATEDTGTHLADRLSGQVTVAAMREHLHRLQGLAEANGGNRADGSPGFAAGADYVAQALRDKGFDVTVTEFSRLDTTAEGKPTLRVAGKQFPVEQASLLVRTPAAGVVGVVARPTKPAGCAADDYPASTPPSAIAVVDDTGCSVIDKQNAAASHGAVAVVVISPPSRRGAPPTLFPTGYFDALTLPVAVAGRDAGSALTSAHGPVKLVLDAVTVKTTSRNVLAQTKTGDEHDVVLVGANLDGPATGPGVNDNGSGVAAVLETALQLGPNPPVHNAVRFAFWGAAAQHLGGSGDYVFGLDRDKLNDIALYLDFRRLGSTNAGFFTYDGDQSGSPSRDFEADQVPAGSAGVERTLAGSLNLAGKRPADLPLSSAADYSLFLVAGVPVGGITTGGDQRKTVTQTRLWGGQVGVAFDGDNRGRLDTLDHVDEDALAVCGATVGFAVGHYAESIEGPNGVPAHDKRHRAPLGP